MIRVVLSDETLRQFSPGDDGIEICDSTGRLVGYFTPAIDDAVYEHLDLGVSIEELQRRGELPGGRTWPEIRADLERLA